MANTIPIKEYPVKLGRSFFNKSALVWTMGYGFRPSSIDDKRRGVMKITKNVSQLSLSTLEGKTVTFEGTVEDAALGECILLFDQEKKCFILEQMGKSIRNLRMKKRKLPLNFQSTQNSTRPATLSKPQKMSSKPAKALRIQIPRPDLASSSIPQHKRRLPGLNPPPAKPNPHSHRKPEAGMVSTMYNKLSEPSRQTQTNTNSFVKPTTLAPAKLALPSQFAPAQKLVPPANLAPAPQMASYGGSAELSSSDDDDDDDLFD